MRKSSVAYTLLLAVLMAGSILPFFVSPSYAEVYMNCVCDHWYNGSYLGTPYDLWTASGVVGYPNGGGPYYSFDVIWEGGYGANKYTQWHPYDEEGPLAQYWSISGSSGTYYNYTLAAVFDIRYAEGTECPGFYDDVYDYGRNAGGSSFVTVAADDTFDLNNGSYYTVYGSDCTIPYYGESMQLVAQPTQATQSYQPIESTPLFDIQITYAHVGHRTDNFSSPNPFKNQPSLNAASLYPSRICLNARYISNITNEVCDAAIEVYQVQLTTDTGVTESYIYTVGTNINPIFSDVTQLSRLRPYIEKLAQGPSTYTMSGYFNLNLTIGNSISDIRIGSAGKYQSDPSSFGFWSAGQPNNATLSVHRLGCILLNENFTSIYYSDSQATTPQLQLTKYNNGLLYNAVKPKT